MNLKNQIIEVILGHQGKVTGSIDENNTNPTDGTTNNFTSNTLNNVNNVLLQTAKATARDLSDLSFANIRIIFDSGSQRIYVNEDLKEILNLKTLRTEKLILLKHLALKNLLRSYSML